MNASMQRFGGDWTEEKLERVQKYLVAYTTIMSHKPFRFAYIDAFAGTGYRSLRQESNQNELMFPEFAEQDSQRFLDGSARIALQVKPRFSKYIFIEQDKERVAELQKLKDEFVELRNAIHIEEAEANSYLQKLCSKNKKWVKHGRRAVLFLDPFGMQVQWETISAIAHTQAIDLWLLFPLGVAVNRLLRRDAQISQAWRRRLDGIFGSQDWFNAFYRTKTHVDLFGEQVSTEKIGDFASIGQYFVERLRTVFVGVADNPLPLYNSRGNPLYLLCFATGNPKGAKTALKIAQDILEK